MGTYFYALALQMQIATKQNRYIQNTVLVNAILVIAYF